MDQPGRVSAGLRQRLSPVPTVARMYNSRQCSAVCAANVSGLSSLSIPCRHCLPRLLSSLPCHSLLHTPRRERKLVTVLCCTVVNAPTLVEALGLDAAHSLMQSLYSMALDEVQRYDGTLQHVTSNSFLVLFSAPVAQEDHARRAVLAALGLQQRLRQSPPVRQLLPGTDAGRYGPAYRSGGSRTRWEPTRTLWRR